MKSTPVSVAVLWGFAALAMTEALPPNSIPMRCATICGPMVELTALCSTPKLLKRGDQRRWRSREGWLRKRDFVTLVPAPTSFPYSLTADLTRPTSKVAAPPRQQPVPSPSRATPGIAMGAWGSPERTTPTTSAIASSRSSSSGGSSSSSSSNRPLAAATPATTGSLLGGPAQATPTSSIPVVGGASNGLSAEERCVCMNRSFDVPRVAALCASCIKQTGDEMNIMPSYILHPPLPSLPLGHLSVLTQVKDMDLIMKVCTFSSTTYSPDKDGVVNNVVVEAARPVVEAAVVVSRASRTSGVGGAVVGVVSLCSALWSASEG
ncbi:hypothetical protein RJ55_01134 [Drechmeria coniospora]|nr:hypothetical protein RJ55_01134 [Drechmeria coniospora]